MNAVQTSRFRAVFKMHLCLADFNQSKMAKCLGIARGTMSAKANNPDSFTAGELIALFRVLKYSDEEILRIMKQK